MGLLGHPSTRVPDLREKIKRKQKSDTIAIGKVGLLYRFQDKIHSMQKLVNLSRH